jgi:hypothetical protein
MDACALARSLDGSRGPDGAVSLRELQLELYRRGLEEFARAVGSLAERLTPVKLEMDSPTAPWF